MATPLTINVRNNSSTLQNFFFFQQPAVYTGGQEVYTNSLYTAPLLPYSTSGAVLTFSVILQYYAGVQQQVSPPAIGQPSGQLAASQAIGLTPASGNPPPNTTDMMVTPSLGLSVPASTIGPQAGAFRIVTPVFNTVLANYNAGSAVQQLTGAVTLSNFVTAQPNSNLDCQPVIVFYVQTGTYTPGTVMNFTSSSVTAAICNFTPGYSTYAVQYNADGTWTTTPFALVRSAAGVFSLVEGSAAMNAEIKNEAGTAVISTGYAANFDPPFQVQNLSNPGAIAQFGEYQVGRTGGPYAGRMCINIAGNVATFGI